MEHGTDAHVAGLERHIERRAGQPVVLEPEGSGAQGLDLGVRRRVAGRDGPIPPFADDLAAEDDERPDRHLALLFRATRELERATHETLVAHARRSGVQTSALPGPCTAANSSPAVNVK